MRNPVKTAKRQLLRVGSCALSALMVLGSIPAAAIGDGVTATYDEAYYAMTDYYGNLTDGSVVKSYRTNGAFGLLPRPLGVGFQRRGPRPPAFVSLGVQGEVETPWCFSSRGVGRVLFQKRMRPTSLRWKPSLAGAENYVKARGIAARFLVIRNHDGCPSKFQALRKGK